MCPAAAIPGRELWPPEILSASHQTRLADQLSALLPPEGYLIRSVTTGAAALAEAERAEPDAVLLDADLPDMEPRDLCATLRMQVLGPHVPILLLSSAAPAPSRERRLGALRAGAWACLALPADAEELLLKLRAYARAKVFVDTVRTESLVDPETGLYNVRGLARRAHELGALAQRRHAPLACVAIAPESPAPASAVRRCVNVLRSSARPGDAVGVMSATELAVLAFGTDADGAVALADRLRRGIESTAAEDGSDQPLTVRGGYDAVSRLEHAPLNAVNLLARARSALRAARSEPLGDWIRPYEEEPVWSA